jgi:hypothetical protein
MIRPHVNGNKPRLSRASENSSPRPNALPLPVEEEDAEVGRTKRSAVPAVWLSMKIHLPEHRRFAPRSGLLFSWASLPRLRLRIAEASLPGDESAEIHLRSRKRSCLWRFDQGISQYLSAIRDAHRVRLTHQFSASRNPTSPVIKLIHLRLLPANQGGRVLSQLSAALGRAEKLR